MKNMIKIINNTYDQAALAIFVYIMPAIFIISSILTALYWNIFILAAGTIIYLALGCLTAISSESVQEKIYQLEISKK